MKIVILYSGGLDSLAMLAIAQRGDFDITCIYYRHGQEATAAELASLPQHVSVRFVDWMNLPGAKLYRHPKQKTGPGQYIPGRNLVFATLAACQELPDEVWIGALSYEAHDDATDKNRQFARLATAAISYVLSPWAERVTVELPLVDRGFDKLDATKLARAHFGDDAVLATVSCFNPRRDSNGPVYCGSCLQCAKRWAVFAALGIRGERYAVNPPTSVNGQAVFDQLEATGYRWNEPNRAAIRHAFLADASFMKSRSVVKTRDFA